jgi:hypothetical protein
MSKTAVVEARALVPMPSFDGLTSLLGVELAPVVAATPPCPLQQERPPLPFCTSQDLLRVHHLLRC